MASRMRSVTSSRDRDCVWHPGSCGTEGDVVPLRITFNHEIKLACQMESDLLIS